jgi:hypothetical protein
MKLGSALMMGAAGVSGEVLDGLVGWWAHANSGDVAATGTWPDASGEGNDGTLVADAFVDSNGVNLDGTGDYVDCGDPAVLSFGNGTSDSAFSTCAWIYRNTVQGWVISKRAEAGTPAEWQWSIFSNSISLVCFDNGGTAAYLAVRMNLTVPSSEWAHLAATYDGSGMASGITLYLNGAEVTTADDSTGVYVAMIDTATPVYIGKWSIYAFTGDIGDVRIYNRSLSQSEIAQIVALNKR